MTEMDKIVVIGASSVTGIGSIVKHIIADACLHDTRVTMIEPKTSIEITNPYNFDMPFQPPLTRRQRRELARKNKLISSTGQRI